MVGSVLSVEGSLASLRRAMLRLPIIHSEGYQDDKKITRELVYEMNQGVRRIRRMRCSGRERLSPGRDGSLELEREQPFGCE